MGVSAGCIKTRLLIRSMATCRCVGCNKSNLMIGPVKRVGMLQSMPTLSNQPKRSQSRLSAWLFQRKLLRQKLG